MNVQNLEANDLLEWVALEQRRDEDIRELHAFHSAQREGISVALVHELAQVLALKGYITTGSDLRGSNDLMDFIIQLQ